MSVTTIRREVEETLPGVRHLDSPSGSMALFIEPTIDALRNDPDAVVEWFVRHRDTLDRLATEVGAVVLRSFAIRQTRDFGALVDPYDTMEFGYSAGVTPRERLEGNVFEATSAPSGFRIPLHQEMSYLPAYPSRLAFYCHRPALSGGETIIGDMRRLTAMVRPAFREALREAGVLYQRNFRSPDWATGHPVLDARHRPWPDAFGTEDEAEVERSCEAMGLDFEWRPDGSLTTRFRGHGLVIHPETGEEVWFNQLVQQATNVENLGQDLFEAYRVHYPPGRSRPFEVCFGDGSPVDPLDISSVYPLIDSVTTGFTWQAGDVMFLDNVNTAHGRNPFTGTRDIQVALLA